jgi:hypothetical protein
VCSNSTNSIDDIINGEDAEVSDEAWKAELNTRMEQISNTKRSSTEGRAESLNAYARILMARYAKDDIEGHMSSLLPSMIKSLRQETTEREAVAALKGMHHSHLDVAFANSPQRSPSLLSRSILLQSTTISPTSSSDLYNPPSPPK